MIEKVLRFYERCRSKEPALALTLVHGDDDNWGMLITQLNTSKLKSSTLIFHDFNDGKDLDLLAERAYTALTKWAKETLDLEDI